MCKGIESAAGPAPIDLPPSCSRARQCEPRKGGFRMCADVLRAVEQFLYREARLLDERRFHEWLELFTEDLRYWMPVRTSRYPKGSLAIVILDEDRYIEEELAQ